MTPLDTLMPHPKKQVRQYFVAGGREPTAALVKATMIHSAQSARISLRDGYGHVDLASVLWFANESLFALRSLLPSPLWVTPWLLYTIAS